MDPRYSPFNITAALAIALTVWVFGARWRGLGESNWPLLYYLGIVVYSYIFPSVLEPSWVYAGVLTALFLRFEFMGGFILKSVRTLEALILAQFVYSFWSALVL